MAERFVHLHLHSEYSLLDGACRIADIPAVALEMGHDAVAITDHGVMYGVIDFYKSCKKAGIKPIIGCEFYVAPDSRFEKDRSLGKNNHLILLAKNMTGYHNLMILDSKAFTEGFYSKPRIDLDLLREHSDGLVCLSACLAGYIPRSIVAGDYNGAEEYAKELLSIFGEGNFYLELQDHGLPDQQVVNEALRTMSQRCNIPMVATNDVHYLRKKDCEAQAILMCIQTNNVITDGRPVGFETDEFYYKSTEEMEALFSDYEGAIENTAKIADMCSLDFEFGNVVLPRFRPDDGSEPSAFLRDLAEKGLKKKLDDGHIVYDGVHTEKTYLDRIDYELGVINSMGYDEYYLIVWDFVNYAKSRDIPVGPGRGSGAGSLVAFLVGITDVDPIKFDLIFERFLNPERVSMPDFDIDFCYDRRDEVIDYVREKYGDDRVCQIITFGTMAARAAVRDVGRALGMAYSRVDQVAKEIPRDIDITLEKALEQSGELRKLRDEDPDIRKLIDSAMLLEGMPRHASTHAAGVVITDKPVTDYVPVAVNSGSIVTQFTMDVVVNDLGLLKFDFLALRYLTIIHDAEETVKRRDPSFDLSLVDINDAGTYELISSGDTDGVFQLESRGMRNMLTQLKPESINDVIAAIALYRPGPMDSIPRYIEARHDPSKIKYKIPAIEGILKPTYGCIVYQEQVMQIFREIAGYSFGHADVVRRAIAKKKADVLESEHDAFVNGAVERGVSEEDADELFKDIVSFANYAFNKSHAAAYAVLSFRTAYLKRHHPLEYYCALLTSVLGSTEKITEYIASLSKRGIKVTPPDINESFSGFSVDGGTIRFGLTALRGVGEQYIKGVVAERNSRGKFRDFDDFLTRTESLNTNKRQLESLIKSGSLDSLGVKRSQLLAVYEKALDLRGSKKPDGQMDLFSSLDGGREEIVPKMTFPDIPELSAREKMNLEKECSGMYLSGHILDDYSDNADAVKHVDIAYIRDTSSDPDDPSGGEPVLRDRQRITVVGLVTGRNVKTTRNGEPMAFITLEDKTGEIELICFNDTLERYGYLLTSDSAVIVRGVLNVREDMDPKIVVNEVGVLAPNGQFDKTKEDKGTVKSLAPLNKTVFLRVPSKDDRICKRAEALISIFPGRTPVIIYDKNAGKYDREHILSADADDFLISELRSIAGDDNVVIRCAEKG